VRSVSFGRESSRLLRPARLPARWQGALFQRRLIPTIVGRGGVQAGDSGRDGNGHNGRGQPNESEQGMRIKRDGIAGREVSTSEPYSTSFQGADEIHRSWGGGIMLAGSYLNELEPGEGNNDPDREDDEHGGG
jgi:hypothetical protein